MTVYRPSGQEHRCLLRFVLTTSALLLGWMIAEDISAGESPSAQVADAERGWPESSPRIRWEQSIRSVADLGRGKLLRRVTGRPDKDLFTRPYGVTIHDSGYVVTDPGAGQVILVTEKGPLVTTKSGIFGSPVGVTSCGEKILVSDSLLGGVALLTRDLTFVRWVAADLERPTGIACLNNTVFVAETAKHRLVVIDDDGKKGFIGHRGNGPREFNYPTALAAAGNDLWVADTLNFRVQRLNINDKSGDFQFGQAGDAPGEMPRIKGIAVDVAGRIWISDAILEQVAVYTDTGAFLLAIGRRGSGPGEFSFPAGIASDDSGRVAVVDSLNRRLQLFRAASNEAGFP